MTIPLFKSHYSIGKSILTLNSPKEGANKEGSDSVFDIAVENKLDNIVLVEDTFMGFLQARKVTDSLGIHFIFGLRFDMCQDVKGLDDSALKKCSHKIIIFPKNSEGCTLLNQIYTECNTKYSGWLDLTVLKSLWDEKILVMGIPFYDSFIFKNLTTFNACVPDFSLNILKHFYKVDHLFLSIAVYNVLVMKLHIL